MRQLCVGPPIWLRYDESDLSPEKFVSSDWPTKVRGLGLAPPNATAMKVAEPAGTTNVENFGDTTTLPIFIRVVVNTCDKWCRA